MLRGIELLDSVKAWASEKGEILRSNAIDLEINESPENRDPQSIQLIFDAAKKLSEIIVWTDGNAELSFADIDSGQITPEYRNIQSTQDLEAALNVTMGWVRGAS
ncbi:immunity protein TriTu family protein [Streptosporangium sp. LJ11]|uniref:immunity protein TriTu family protein n=1 Tax=Streptosporangium sp. LJ11 TaxID=3436927 RepID=UPI003F79AA36